MKNKKQYIYIFSFLFIFISAISSFAVDNKKIKAGNTPVKIQSDSMKYYGNERKSVFEGNVVAVSDNYTLTSNQVTVFLNKKMDVDKILCNGNVNFKTDDIVSISDKADVDQTKGIAIISGGVKVWQGENYLEGEKVFMYYNENRIVVDKGTQKRVTIIFKPEDEGK